MYSTTSMVPLLMVCLAVVPIAHQQNPAEIDGSKMGDYIVIHDKGQNMLLQVALQERSKGEEVKVQRNPIDEEVDAFCTDPSNGNQAYHMFKKNMIMFGDKSIAFQGEVLHMEYDPCGDQLFWNTKSHIYGWKVETDSVRLMYSLPSPNQIACITLDLDRDQVYWTQNEAIQKGEVWRMRSDGSDVTKVFTATSALHAATIDHEMSMLNVMAATGGMLYMMPLDLMEKVTDLHTPVHIDYETERYVKSKSIIIDIVSYHGRIYFVHPESGRIYRFSLVLGPSSMEEYGNVTVSRSGSISSFSKTHYDRNIAGLRRCKTVHFDEKERTLNPKRPTPAPTIYEETSVPESTASDAVTTVKSNLQQISTSTTKPMRISTPLISSNIATTHPSLINGKETFTPLNEVTYSLDLDRTHPCFQLLEQPGEKTVISRAFQLCVAISGLL